MSKIWTNGDTIIILSKKTLWEKEKMLFTSNFSFAHNVFKSCLMLICQNEYQWSKGLNDDFCPERKENIIGKGENAGNPNVFKGLLL